MLSREAGQAELRERDEMLEAQRRDMAASFDELQRAQVCAAPSAARTRLVLARVREWSRD